MLGYTRRGLQKEAHIFIPEEPVLLGEHAFMKNNELTSRVMCFSATMDFVYVDNGWFLAF